MKNINITTSFSLYSLSELGEIFSNLIKQALQATDHAYAPYSHFQVGAAVLLENGKIVTGSNQENAAYPSGLCAERVAIFHAGHQYPAIPIVALAIAASTQGKQVENISPCGACRQVLLETEQRQGVKMKVFLCGTKEVMMVNSAGDLLPFCFGKKDLKEF